MARKPMTEEHKAKMIAARKASQERKAAEASQEPSQEPIQQPIQPAPQSSNLEALVEQLMLKVSELEKQKNPNMNAEAALATTATMQGYDINVSNNGVQGRVFKYPVEKSYYADPTERLYDEPLLRRYGLRENYHFDWDVEGVEYEKYNVTYAEPRFTIRLFRKIYDDNNELTGQVALVNRAIVHEDEVIARIGAEKLGIADQFSDFKDMMNEMRYYRFRSWLLDLFTPARIQTRRNFQQQMVIDGKVVEMYDTEVIIDKGDAESKTSTIENEVRI